MINLYNKDCMLAMKEMEANEFDLAIVDPPYGIGAAKRFHRNGITSKQNHWGEYPEKYWDSNAPDQDYFDELRRVSKNQIIWGGNYFMDKIRTSSQCWLIWNKCQREFSLADGELAWTSFDRAMRIFDCSRPRAKESNLKTGGMFHPTKKPVDLYAWILSKYAKEGDRILDTHLGSGSIAIACHDLGFDLEGYEIDEEYYQAALQRLQNHQRQLKLW